MKKRKIKKLKKEIEELRDRCSGLENLNGRVTILEAIQHEVDYNKTKPKKSWWR